MPDEDEIDFKSLVEQSVDVICCSSFDRLVRYISPSCYQLLGFKPEELIGKGPDAYILADDLPLLDVAGARILASEAQSAIATLRMRRKDGSIVWVEINVRLVRDPVTAEPKEHVIIMRDISERQKMVDRLTALALLDGLTRLSNRHSFDAALEREWKRTLREGAPLSMLLLDIDHFKKLNDHYGHQAGDDSLRAAAGAATAALRATDIIARYGGDEIAVLLSGAGPLGAAKVAEKIRSAVECLEIPHVGNGEGGGMVTVSIGVATAFADQDGAIGMPAGLLLAADRALYKAKQRGRNRVTTAALVAR